MGEGGKEQIMWHGYVECRYCGFHFISDIELRQHWRNDCCEAKKVRDVLVRMTGNSSEEDYERRIKRNKGNFLANGGKNGT